MRDKGILQSFTDGLDFIYPMKAQDLKIQNDKKWLDVSARRSITLLLDKLNGNRKLDLCNEKWTKRGKIR